MLSKRYLSSLILILLFLLLSALIWLNPAPNFLLPQPLAPTMSITHIVLVQFKADTPPAAVKDVRILHLPHFSALQQCHLRERLFLFQKHVLTKTGLFAHARPERQLRPPYLPETIYQIRRRRSG